MSKSDSRKVKSLGNVVLKVLKTLESVDLKVLRNFSDVQLFSNLMLHKYKIEVFNLFLAGVEIPKKKTL